MSSQPTVLVIGGTGFVGSYTANELCNRGAEVVAFDKSTDAATIEKLGIADEVGIRKGDVTDPIDVMNAIRETGASHIVHLASLLTPAARANPRTALKVNVEGTNNVFEAAKTFDDQIERVSWASSLAVYAPPEKYDGEPVSEDALVYPETHYGGTKVYNEQQASLYRGEYDLSLVGLRPTLVYGPYRVTGSTQLTNVIEKPAKGEAYTMDHGDQLIDWLHIEDAARGFAAATFADEEDLTQEVYNISGSTGTIREAADVVRDIVPDADLTITDEGSYPWNFNVDRSAAEADLGYSPEYDLESGFKQYINAVQEEQARTATPN